MTNDERAALEALADYLIPTAEGMPSATETDMIGRFENQVLRLRPDLLDCLADAADLLQGLDGRAIAIALHSKRPTVFAKVSSALAATYYMDETVRRLLRYPGQLRMPVPEAELSPASNRALLACVIERGKIYRPTKCGSIGP